MPPSAAPHRKPDPIESLLQTLFGDRLWTLKLAGAVALLAFLGHRARREFERDYPSYRKVPVHHDRMTGRTVSLWAKTVTAATPDGFDIDTDVGRFHVIGPDRPPPGERVSLRARVAGPRTLEALAVQRNEGVLWKRPVNYVVSILAAALFLLWMSRLFRWPLRTGLFRSRS